MIKDLIILVPGKDEKLTLEGLLARNRALGIQSIVFNIYVHPNRDPGVYRQAADFLRPFTGLYAHALVFLDREGSGQELKSVSKIENEIRGNLHKNGWENRAEVIVFDPELEIWAWVKSTHLAVELGWENVNTLYSFLQEKNYFTGDSAKPIRPKEAFEDALRQKRIPRSSAIYKNIASKVSFKSCQDPAFHKLRTILKNWFGEK